MILKKTESFCRSLVYIRSMVEMIIYHFFYTCMSICVSVSVSILVQNFIRKYILKEAK